MTLAATLLDIYKAAVDATNPRVLVRQTLSELRIDARVTVVALGKCAAAMCEGALDVLDVESAVVAVPEHYPLPGPDPRIEVVVGSHPRVTEASLAAGARLQRIVRESRWPVVFLVSGGSSACVEAALPQIGDETLLQLQPLARAGLSIEALNCVRKHLSAIKGGRLAEMTSRVAANIVFSDVDPATPYVVGSGPTCADPTTNADAAAILESLDDRLCRDVAQRLRHPDHPETPKQLDTTLHVAADNDTLKRAAAEAGHRLGFAVTTIDEQIVGDAATAAHELARRVAQLPPGHLLVAGGETVVTVRGEGRGGRCSEMAAHLALLSDELPPFTAMFAGSDGVDGNSGAAGVCLDSAVWRSSNAADRVRAALVASDTISIAEAVGGAIRISPTGNNLRDLFLLARH